MLLPDQEEFFRFFEITPPADMSVEGARRFMEAFLKDPAKRAQWEQHTGQAPPAPAVPASVPAPAGPAMTEGFTFTGSGGEYFGIWIVNLLLTIVTLGIYGPWAKVRRLQYFYRHTQLAGASFDYHGDPVAILKGRIVAFGLLLVYNLGIKLSGVIGLLSLVFLGVALPWLLRNSLRFRLRNSSYRGLRFGFKGDLKGAFEAFLFLPLAALVTLYMAWPWAHHRLKEYQHNSSRYGSAAFSFDATIGSFYKQYLILSLLGMVLMIVPIVLMFGAFAKIAAAHAAAGGAGTPPDPRLVAGATIIAFAGVFGTMMLLAPLYQARMQNLIWNHTVLGPHRFASALSTWRLAGVYLSNLLLVVLTLGFFMPWAAVRLTRCKVEALSLQATDSLEHFAAAQEGEVGAMGEETADLFDIDIAL